jgi:hypothetical protein
MSTKGCFVFFRGKQHPPVMLTIPHQVLLAKDAVFFRGKHPLHAVLAKYALPSSEANNIHLLCSPIHIMHFLQNMLCLLQKQTTVTWYAHHYTSSTSCNH